MKIKTIKIKTQFNSLTTQLNKELATGSQIKRKKNEEMKQRGDGESVENEEKRLKDEEDTLEKLKVQLTGVLEGKR